jgi:hypothetical protein
VGDAWAGATSAKMHSYTAALEAFARAVELMPRPIERVEVDSPDGSLPGYLIPSRHLS